MGRRGGNGVVSGCVRVRDWRRRRPRAGPLPWVPAFARTTVGGRVGRAGAGGGVPPPGAPLDTGFRRYDGGGCGKFERRRRPRAGPRPWVPAKAGTTVGGVCGTRGSWWWRRALRQAQGERNLEARLRCGLVGACGRLAHLWIPAFAGTTMAGVGMTRAGDCPAPPPLQSTNGHVLLVGVPAFAGTTVGGLYDGAYAAVHVYGGAGYEAGSL